MSLNYFLLIKGCIHIFGSVGGAINHPFLLFVMVNVPVLSQYVISVWDEAVFVVWCFSSVFHQPYVATVVYHMVLFSGKDHYE